MGYKIVEKEPVKSNPYLILRDDLYCRYCGKQCKNLNSLTQHEIRCNQNPERNKVRFRSKDSYKNLSNESRKKLGWSKGLTKDTDERVKRISKGVIKSLSKRIPGKASSTEKEIQRCQKISLKMKNNPNAGGVRANSGRGKKGKYKGYYCDSTYELVYIIYNIDHNIFFERNLQSYEYMWRGEIHKYYPDFLLEDGSLVEIKGFLTDKDRCKLSAVKDRNIILLMQKDLSYAFDYVKNNYSYNELTDLYDK